MKVLVVGLIYGIRSLETLEETLIYIQQLYKKLI